MPEDNESRDYHQDEGLSARDYLHRADDAVATGNEKLAIHLYLTAFERSLLADLTPEDDVIDGLREAWVLACELENRSMAEYIFTQLEPYLSQDELSTCTEALHQLALSKLNEIGLPADALEGLADAVMHGLAESDAEAPAHIMRIDGPFTVRAGNPVEFLRALREATTEKVSEKVKRRSGADTPKEDGENDLLVTEEEHLDYSNICGYAETIRDMRALGIGLNADPEYRAFVSMLNARHGLPSAPALDALLFRSPAREDAHDFMMATAGEIGKPVMRMRVEENYQGIPVLCVMAHPDCAIHLNAARTAFEGAGTLVLEDIDLWLPPVEETEESVASVLMAQIMRSAHDALNVIRTAVENPAISVLASASTELTIPDIFLDLLDPFTMVDIDIPSAGERAEIWMDIARRHSSLRAIDRAKLVRCSANMPRVDIYMAAREAIEEAYRQAIALREYVPVSSAIMFEKLANFQPIGSDEYSELEESVMGDLRTLLDADVSLDELLGLGEFEELTDTAAPAASDDAGDYEDVGEIAGFNRAVFLAELAQDEAAAELEDASCATEDAVQEDAAQEDAVDIAQDAVQEDVADIAQNAVHEVAEFAVEEASEEATEEDADGTDPQV